MRLTDHIYLVASSEFGLSEGDCHVYAIDTGSEVILIDAGGSDDPSRLLTNVVESGLDLRRLSHVLLTHAHRDHAGGLAALRAAADEGRVGRFRAHASAEEMRLLEHGTHVDLGLDLFGLQDRSGFPPARVDSVLADGQVLAVGELRLRVIIVPGHSPGCTCFFGKIDGLHVLFGGDVVFSGGFIGVGNWPGSSHDAYRISLPKLAGLGVDALLPGHGIWTLRNGQKHIDRALEDFRGLWPPPNLYGRR